MSDKKILFTIDLHDFIDKVRDWYHSQEIHCNEQEEFNITSSITDIVVDIFWDFEEDIDASCAMWESIAEDVEKTLDGAYIDDQCVDDIQPFSDRLVVYEDLSFEFVKD